MNESLISYNFINGENEEYSLEEEVKEILRKPLVNILVSLMLINDIFLYFQKN